MTGKLLIAFIGGILSFFSPCILPVFPSFLCFLTGYKNNRPQNFTLAAVAYVFGFSIIFTLLGASASALGSLLQENMLFLEKASGVLIVLFGIHLTGLIKIPRLEENASFNARSFKSRSFLLNAFFFGIAFGISWTPCIGPLLASILLLSAASQTVMQGSLLLFVFSLGLGIPYIFSAATLGYFESELNFISKNSKYFSFFSGFFLIIIGIIILFGRLEYINSYLLKWFNY